MWQIARKAINIEAKRYFLGNFFLTLKEKNLMIKKVIISRNNVRINPDQFFNITGWMKLKLFHQDILYAPKKLPIAKNGKDNNAVGFPDPALTKIPDPQPFKICIPIPKINAPIIIDRPIGAVTP